MNHVNIFNFNNCFSGLVYFLVMSYDYKNCLPVRLCTPFIYASGM